MRALLAVVACLVLLGMPSASAQPAQQVHFTINAALGGEWLVTVPRWSEVTIDVVLLNGMVPDLTLDLSGVCPSAELSLGPSGPGMPAQATVDCGLMPPSTFGMDLGTLLGAGTGYLVLHGMYATE